MSVTKQSQLNQRKGDGGHTLLSWIQAHMSHICESFWFCLAFVLFIILGPFSAVVVLIGLGNLASEESRSKLVEPASI